MITIDNYCYIQTGENEMDNYLDLNTSVDRILDIVLKYGGDRKVIFSTFHADACIMWGLPDVNDVLYRMVNIHWNWQWSSWGQYASMDHLYGTHIMTGPVNLRGNETNKSW